MIIGDDQWVIDAQKFCGLSITHWCNWLPVNDPLIDWLLIDDPLITHRLLYYARKALFLLSCTILYSSVILLSVLDAFFLVSEVPVDYVKMQSANHKYRWFSIVQFAKLNNLDGRGNRQGVVQHKRQKHTKEPSEAWFPCAT